MGIAAERISLAASKIAQRDGRLVEDKTDDYLTTAQATIPPAPASVNEVASAEALTREVDRVQRGYLLDGNLSCYSI